MTAPELMNLDVIIREFLNRLEAEEAKLLSWGVVDGGYSREEMEERAEAYIESSGAEVSPVDLLKEMRNRRVLFDLNVGGRRLYRTRMAEAVRLLARLRLLVPSRKWQVSPTLVADYRFSLRQRVYPRRHVKPEQAIGELKSEKLLDGRKEAALLALLRSADRGEVELADFQLRATRTMLRDLAGGQSRGMIVGAATGTGKTLAFYLPALSHIAGLLSKDSFWTKALALYPRNELLKDQLLETYTEARRLDQVLAQTAGRKLLIGAFFGPTPRRATEAELEKKWETQSGGYICPYLPCPKCEGNLIWLKADVQRQAERLHCAGQGCGTVVSQDEVILTRERMAKTPPDVLFTTTEMLNRQMSDSFNAHVFGLGVRRPPQLVLLDEVHTYSGVHGAQVAYLIRRWRKLAGGRVHFTGLSATLRNAGEFFAQLVGLSPASVEEISQGEDLVTEGMEYQLALRGDPVSGASLLSTSIQTLMLLRRTLDPSTDAVSKGFYGTRVFAFTDDLDVTNRLYHNLRSAERYDNWGRPIPNVLPLAALRAQGGPEAAQRLPAGQSWQMCESVGHNLTRRLKIGRTSSQDVGVQGGADVIVATASLEVGFNDPEVGAVLQHKAPRDMASFLQRKGRAGRKRVMRPWTVVVLSDYGRDRIAYQGYDLLFDPMLDERSLSVGNRYVLRMQAVFAFMDWVSDLLRRERMPGGSVWNEFAGPAPQMPARWAEQMRARQERAVEIIRGVLDSDDLRLTLEEYLSAALRISDEEVQALLWEPPRALMTAALPTLLRRLESGWKRVKVRQDEAESDRQEPFAPLPDFIPQNLFSDLNLPEVRVITPPQQQGGEPLVAHMPVIQALREFAPGRVSRRFGIYNALASHWIAPLDLSSSIQELPIGVMCAEYEEAGTFQMPGDGDETVDVRCVRPWELRPQLPPADVDISSNAFLDWRSQLVPSDEGLGLDLPEGSPWLDVIKEIKFFTHNQRSHVEVRRFAVGSRANLKFDGGREIESYIQFVEGEGGAAASVGFAQDVDGLVFRFNLPENFGVRPDDQNREKVRAFRTAYFRHRIINEDRLGGVANQFQREWLYQIYLSTLTAKALAESSSLSEANTSIQSGNVGEEMGRVLEVIFQTLDIDESGEEIQTENAPQRRQSTHERLLALCRNPAVTGVLGELARVLWENPDAEWERWAIQRFKATLGAALLETCYQLCPHFESGELLVDIEAGPRPAYSPAPPEELDEIWVTESTLGGGGVIEEVIRRYNADPRNFFRLLGSVLEASDFEVVDAQMTRILELISVDAEVRGAMQQLRAAEGHEGLRRADEQLRRLLASRAVLVTHPVMASLNARVLKPGSSHLTDELLWELLLLWREEEERIGVEIDARVYAYVASSTDRLDRAIAHLGLPGQPNPTWRFQAIYGLLWPRGNIARSRALTAYHPFASLPEVDRDLVLDALRRPDVRVRLGDGWRQQVGEALKEHGTVSLVAESAEQRNLSQAVLELVAEPLDVDFLHLYPQIEGFRREPGGLVVSLGLRETIQ